MPHVENLVSLVTFPGAVKGRRQAARGELPCPAFSICWKIVIAGQVDDDRTGGAGAVEEAGQGFRDLESGVASQPPPFVHPATA